MGLRKKKKADPEGPATANDQVEAPRLELGSVANYVEPSSRVWSSAYFRPAHQGAET